MNTTMLIGILMAVLPQRRRARLARESYDWVAGEIMPGETGWEPRVRDLLRHAPARLRPTT
jgi:hypothetical protein